jgi:hypothetical protein
MRPKELRESMRCTTSPVSAFTTNRTLPKRSVMKRHTVPSVTTIASGTCARVPSMNVASTWPLLPGRAMGFRASAWSQPFF